MVNLNVCLLTGLIAEQFLESTATQLSYHGLCELNTTAKEGELSVFFRNNHFSTMIKHKVFSSLPTPTLSIAAKLIITTPATSSRFKPTTTKKKKKILMQIFIAKIAQKSLFAYVFWAQVKHLAWLTAFWTLEFNNYTSLKAVFSKCFFFFSCTEPKITSVALTYTKISLNSIYILKVFTEVYRYIIDLILRFYSSTNSKN